MNLRADIERFSQCYIKIRADNEEELCIKFNNLGATSKMPISVKPNATPTATDDGMYYDVYYWIER